VSRIPSEAVSAEPHMTTKLAALLACEQVKAHGECFRKAVGADHQLGDDAEFCGLSLHFSPARAGLGHPLGPGVMEEVGVAVVASSSTTMQVAAS